MRGRGVCRVVRDVAFRSEGQTVRAVWTHPDSPPLGPRPACVLCPDCALTQEVGLPGVARWLQAAGYASLRLDYRGWGGSDGAPRGVIHPQRQVQDVRAAVTFLQLRREVDAARIAAIGWGLGGGIALQAGALDTRIRAVLVVDPVGDGERWLASLHGLGHWGQWQRRLAQDRLNRGRTDYSEYVPGLGPRSEGPVGQLHAPLFPVGPRVAAWLDAQPAGAAAGRMSRFVPLESADHIAAFRPERFVDLIAGRGACVVAHAEDSLVGIAEAQACARALRADALRLAPPGLISDRHELWAPPTLAWLAHQVSDWLVRWLPVVDDPWRQAAALGAAPRLVPVRDAADVPQGVGVWEPYTGAFPAADADHPLPAAQGDAGAESDPAQDADAAGSPAPEAHGTGPPALQAGGGEPSATAAGIPPVAIPVSIPVSVHAAMHPDPDHGPGAPPGPNPSTARPRTNRETAGPVPAQADGAHAGPGPQTLPADVDAAAAADPAEDEDARPAAGAAQADATPRTSRARAEAPTPW